MIPAFLAIILLVRITAAGSSLSVLTLPPANRTPSDANLTANLNSVSCTRYPDPETLSDFSACIPSLFDLYATPQIHTFIAWDPGDFKIWGPGTDLGGCYIMVEGGRQRDVFAVDSLVSPAIHALNKCFVGSVEQMNVLAKTKVGLGNDWTLTVGLEKRRVRGNDSLS